MNPCSDPAEFRCPACGDCFETDGPIRAALLASGCVSCGSPVTSDAFGRSGAG